MVKQQLKLLRIGKKKSIFQYVSLYVDFSVNSFANPAISGCVIWLYGRTGQKTL